MRNLLKIAPVLACSLFLASCGNSDPLSVDAQRAKVVPAMTNDAVNVVVATMDVKNSGDEPVIIHSVQAQDENGNELVSAWPQIQGQMGNVPAEMLTHDWVLDGPGDGLPTARDIRSGFEQSTGFDWGTPLLRATLTRQTGFFSSSVSAAPLDRTIEPGDKIAPASFVIVVAGHPHKLKLNINYEYDGKAKSAEVDYDLD